MTEAMRKAAEEIVYRFGVENTEEDFQDCVADVARIITTHIDVAPAMLDKDSTDANRGS